MIQTTYIGIIDGMKTWEVKDTETNQVIGYNQTSAEE